MQALLHSPHCLVDGANGDTGPLDDEGQLGQNTHYIQEKMAEEDHVDAPHHFIVLLAEALGFGVSCGVLHYLSITKMTVLEQRYNFSPAT